MSPAAGLERLPFAAAWRALDLGADVEPATVGGRLLMYRRLVEQVGGGLGPGGELSPFWGYAAQLMWQAASGRLGDAGGGAIAPNSWWGACNFSLSAIPYHAAAEFRLVPLVIVDARGYEPALPHWHAAPPARSRRGPRRRRTPTCCERGRR